ncbi:MAG: hypothetical protein V4685_01485, partial [Bacteroidota bacterium]
MLHKYYILLLLMLPFYTMAQKPVFKSIPPEYELEYIRFNNKNDLGLFQNINEDNEGNLWLTGTKGLHFFDGNQVITYTCGNKPFSLLPDSTMGWLYWIHKDKEGNFWVQEGEKRHFYFDTHRRKTIFVFDEKKDTTDKIYCSALDSNGIFFTTVVNNNNKTFSIYRKIKTQPLEEVYKTRHDIKIPFLYRFSCNNHWLIYKDVVKRISSDGKKERSYRIPGGIFFHSNSDKKKFYLINSTQDALYKWNAVTDSMEQFAHL